MKLRLSLFLLLSCQSLFAQDSVYARRIVDTLTSRYFWGRGYTNDGMGKAARFITSEFKSFGLQPLSGKDFVQPFTYNANIYPGKMKVAINGIDLKPGVDFIVSPESMGVKADGKLQQKDSVTFLDAEHRIVVLLQNKLTWSVEQAASDYTAIDLDKKAITKTPSSISVDIENKIIKDFKTGNICAMVRGTAKPDSFIVLTAHYDHLGGMGADTYFPGANDNASGVSQVMSLAKYYAKHPQRYSMVFICFAGEEAGLLGSMYFAEHPLMPLANIRFLINLDLEGTGEEGITVVNATIYPKEFEQLKKLNTQGHYLYKVYSRGKAPNSDHYPFTEKGVPAFYMYTMGGIKAYHDVFDISKTLPLNEYNHLFKLIVDFVGAETR
ncbi:M28 family peptidase [Mucilaginibacter sp. BJC16-A38]|uniref:M28 family metallopeptidase n=1 Tax=Mucilaginibacter phenanthrenivorans TaxID=1234842 RepID=UPI002157E446|nr:M28 family peptidase [Mucilaginibacter phenanthrenivorans]MCR8560221.1 M28 family peptidase [Mucilaginibacter phenanthrenivorans]